MWTNRCRTDSSGAVSIATHPNQNGCLALCLQPAAKPNAPSFECGQSGTQEQNQGGLKSQKPALGKRGVVTNLGRSIGTLCDITKGWFPIVLPSCLWAESHWERFSLSSSGQPRQSEDLFVCQAEDDAWQLLTPSSRRRRGRMRSGSAPLLRTSSPPPSPSHSPSATKISAARLGPAAADGRGARGR